jgi:hypothetical protein
LHKAINATLDPDDFATLLHLEEQGIHSPTIAAARGSQDF